MTDLDIKNIYEPFKEKLKSIDESELCREIAEIDMEIANAG